MSKMKYGLSNFLSPETPSWAFLLLGDFFLKKKKKFFSYEDSVTFQKREVLSRG